MKALVYTSPNEVRFQDYPDPQLEPGEVVIKIKAVGICGSDMHAYHGRDPRRNPGLVMGHELAGEIVQSASPRFAAGQRVTANPLITCGHCRNCYIGHDNLCEHRGMVGMTRPGAYAEYMSIPADSVVPLPDDLSDVEAALAEPAASVMHALNVSLSVMRRPVREGKALVIGGGAIGLLMTLLLESCGVRHLDLAETNALRRQSSARHVRARVFDPLAEAPEESSYDYVVDAVGREETRAMAVRALRPLGVFMHIGLQHWDSPMDMRKITLAELAVLGTYCYTHADLLAAVDALNDKVFGNLAWVDRQSLADGAEAFRALHEGKSAAAKIVLVP